MTKCHTLQKYISATHKKFDRNQLLRDYVSKLNTNYCLISKKP